MTNYYDKTFAVFGLVILLATTSYYLVEYPSQLLAQRLSRLFSRLASYEHEKIVEQSGTDSGASESGMTASTPEQKEKLSSTN
ncbi:hypothetical protein PC129_g10976 [Phytophthora cactorum]|nr:hypothetical protein PC112_g12631 [Phytophthora cactorum]KAG2913450.1 hypothetical protein PC115_g12030 [Phytophthora cactorum]KAG2931878.1 hypothetical protein PC117_g13288 [Phytophthora cactorum]KAG3158273.1 hypothetical protein C6341_g14464 [Phytophthora cactorum]KAG3218208.1 hypothetical protein PC129_g10976 [Phytophthora cactorum]